MATIEKFYFYQVSASRVIKGVQVLKVIKVGCTRNFELRKKQNENNFDEDVFIELIGEYEGTAKEAGDIEWALADELSVPRGQHYALSSKALTDFITTANKETRKKHGIGTENNPNIKDANYRLKRGIGLENMDYDKHLEIALRGGRTSAKNRLSKKGNLRTPLKRNKLYLRRYNNSSDLPN